MTKRTLTVMSGFVAVFAIAIIAIPKLEIKSQPISKKSTSHLEVKTTKKVRPSTEDKDKDGYTTVEFGITGSFDEPNGFSLEAKK
ncbi:hypothetical protein H7X65_01840 [Candidatus Parcubacteria bacterium]|nr:hypothetical protein [Candidatus Parcubacteria bacterium]